MKILNDIECNFTWFELNWDSIQFISNLTYFNSKF
jgi:hypothetical protein